MAFLLAVGILIIDLVGIWWTVWTVRTVAICVDNVWLTAPLTVLLFIGLFTSCQILWTCAVWYLQIYYQSHPDNYI